MTFNSNTVAPDQDTTLRTSSGAPPAVRIVAWAFILFALPSFFVFMVHAFKTDFSGRTWEALIQGCAFSGIGSSLISGDRWARGAAVSISGFLTFAAVVLIADLFVRPAAAEFSEAAGYVAMLAVCGGALVLLLQSESKLFFRRDR